MLEQQDLRVKEWGKRHTLSLLNLDMERVCVCLEQELLQSSAPPAPDQRLLIAEVALLEKQLSALLAGSTLSSPILAQAVALNKSNKMKQSASMASASPSTSSPTVQSASDGTSSASASSLQTGSLLLSPLLVEEASAGSGTGSALGLESRLELEDEDWVSLVDDDELALVAAEVRHSS